MAKMSGVSSTRRLRTLLSGAKDDLGLTLDKIVERAGGRLKRSTAANLLKQEYRSEPLDRATLEAIADGFGVPYEQVREAHLEDMGLLTTNYDAVVELAMQLTPLLRQLDSEREREIVLAVARASADALRRTRNDIVHRRASADIFFTARDEHGTEATFTVEVKERGHGVSEAAVRAQLLEYLAVVGFTADEQPTVSVTRMPRKKLEAVPDEDRPVAARRGKPEHARGDEDP